MICRHCGATLPPIAMFCGSCGRSVAARTPVVPPVVLTAAAPVFSVDDVLSITPATPPEPPEDAAPIPSSHESAAPVHPVPAPVCASCGTEGESDDLFCAECGEAMPQDTRVIERLPASAPAEGPQAASGLVADPPDDRSGESAADPAGEPAGEPGVAEPSLPGWASLLTGSSAPATSGPAAQSTAAAAVVVPGQPAAMSTPPPARPTAPPPVRPTGPPPVAPVAPVDDEVVEPAAPVADRSDPRPLAPPLAPPPRLDPDVESTRLVPRSSTGARFVLQFSTGESYTVVGSGLIGRNPRSEPGEVVDHLVTIVDPGRSVSKTHLEFGQDSGVFFISDRHSGNGTIIREPGAEPRYAEPGRRYRVVRGTRVDLGEQFVVIS